MFICLIVTRKKHILESNSTRILHKVCVYTNTRMICDSVCHIHFRIDIYRYLYRFSVHVIQGVPK